MRQRQFDHAQAVSDVLSGETLATVAERNGVSRDRLRKIKQRGRQRAHARAREAEAALAASAPVLPHPEPTGAAA